MVEERNFERSEETIWQFHENRCLASLDSEDCFKGVSNKLYDGDFSLFESNRLVSSSVRIVRHQV